MKELSIEQKAKAYDEAIKEASIAYKDEDNENMNSLCVLLDQMVSINAIGNEHSIEYKNWLESLKERVGE